MSIFLDTSIISFYISLVGIIGMISFKARELKTGKESWITRLSSKTNDRVRLIYKKFLNIIKYINRRSALVFVQWIAYHVLTWARDLYIWAYKKAHAHAPSKKVIDMVRGKGEINRNAGSSFYLKNITRNNMEEAVEMKK